MLVPAIPEGKQSHFLLPDAETLLRFLDVFEAVRDWHHIVILKTVLSMFEASAAPRAFFRLKRMISDASRGISIFSNEHQAATYVRRSKGTPSFQRDLVAVTRAAEYISAAARAKDASSGAENPPPRVIVIWNPVKGKPLDGEYERINGVVYDSMGGYLSRWCQNAASASRVYESVIEAEKLNQQAAMNAAKFLSAESDGEGLGTDRKATGTVAAGGGAVYCNHLSTAEIDKKMRSGSVVVGTLRVSKRNPSFEAKVSVVTAVAGDGAAVGTPAQAAARHGKVYIWGFEERNRALDGDSVYVQILPRSKWSLGAASSYSRIVQDNEGVSERRVEWSATRRAHVAESTGSAVPCGVVVGIRKRNWRALACTIQREEKRSGAEGRRVYCVPVDRRFPKLRIRTRQFSALYGQRLLCQIWQWPARDRFPSGYYLRSLGPIGDLETEVATLCVEHAVHHPPFSRALLRHLPPRDQVFAAGAVNERVSDAERFAWNVPEEQVRVRRDLRTSHAGCVFSIDPVGCVDIDDALSVRQVDGGAAIEVGVHIADVSHFVPHGSGLDREARERGTSVYLVDRRLDMLPKELSEDLCSLRGGTDRLAVSVLWKFDPKNYARIGEPWFGRTVIHNSGAVSYEEAQRIVQTPLSRLIRSGVVVNGDPVYTGQGKRGDDFETALSSMQEKFRVLRDLSIRLRQNRMDNGAMELHSFVPEFELDAKKTRVKKVVVDAHDLDMHRAVEELMVLANCAVARRISRSKFGASGMLRRHAPPDQRDLEPLRDYLAGIGVTLADGVSNKALKSALAAAEATIVSQGQKMKRGGPVERKRHLAERVDLIRSMATKAMTEAQYLSSGDVSEKDYAHFGLAVPVYTHFTSPIRRYPDIIVHRQLLLAVGDSKVSGSDDDTLDLVKSKALVEMQTPTFVRAVAENANAKSRAAKAAATASQDLFLYLFLLSSGPRLARAVVYTLRDNGFLALLPDYQVKVPCRLSDATGRATGVVTAAALDASSGEGVIGDDDQPTCVATRSVSSGTDTLRVRLSTGNEFNLNVFDVVTVQVSVDKDLAVYRVPRPTARLVIGSNKVNRRIRPPVADAAAAPGERRRKVVSKSVESKSGKRPAEAASGAKAGVYTPSEDSYKVATRLSGRNVELCDVFLKSLVVAKRASSSDAKAAEGKRAVTRRGRATKHERVAAASRVLWVAPVEQQYINSLTAEVEG